MSRDKVKARLLHADGIYRRVERPQAEPAYRVQVALLEYATRRTDATAHGALST